MLDVSSRLVLLCAAADVYVYHDFVSIYTQFFAVLFNQLSSYLLGESTAACHSHLLRLLDTELNGTEQLYLGQTFAYQHRAHTCAKPKIHSPNVIFSMHDFKSNKMQVSRIVDNRSQSLSDITMFWLSGIWHADANEETVMKKFKRQKENKTMQHICNKFAGSIQNVPTLKETTRKTERWGREMFGIRVGKLSALGIVPDGHKPLPPFINSPWL